MKRLTDEQRVELRAMGRDWIGDNPDCVEYAQDAARDIARGQFLDEVDQTSPIIEAAADTVYAGILAALKEK